MERGLIFGVDTVELLKCRWETRLWNSRLESCGCWSGRFMESEMLKMDAHKSHCDMIYLAGNPRHSAVLRLELSDFEAKCRQGLLSVLSAIEKN